MVYLFISVLLICGIVVKSSPIARISAQPGVNVTVWCQHHSKIGKYIHWFKQLSGAVPLSIVNMMISHQLKEPNTKYLNDFQAERFVMSLNTKNISLNILNVDVSDSGLYYCGWVDWEMKFGDGTHLEIKVKDETEKRVTALKTETYVTNKDLKSPISTKHCPGNIFYRLTFIFGGFIVVLIIIFLTLVIIKIRKAQDKDADRHATQNHEEPPSSVYSAIKFSKGKTRRADRHTEDIDVVYSATR